MAERDLDIKLKLDRTQAEQSATAFHRAEQVRQRELTEVGRRAFKGLGDAGAEAFRRIDLSTLLTRDMIRGLTSNVAEFVAAFGRAITDAQQKSLQLTKQFSESRDTLGELATLMGRTADNQFTLDIGRFNRATGFRPEEGRQFLTEFYNTGAQFLGRLGTGDVGQREQEQYRIQAGQLGLARQLEPTIIGDLAGAVLGFRDYSKLGEGASEAALGTLNQALAVLGRGRGANATLARQFSQLAAATLNEDEMMGVFQDPSDLAAVVSIAAEQNPEEAAATVRAVMRGIRGFDKKRTAPLLQRAKITPKTEFIPAMEQLAPVVVEEAAREGKKVEDVLAEYFEDQLTRTGIATMINRGVVGGGFEDRLRFGRKVQGPAPAEAMIGEYMAGERGQKRMADADVILAELERGAENSKLEVVRRQALAELIRSREIDTATTNIQDYLFNRATFGTLGTAEQRRIDVRARDILNRRTPEAAIPEGGMFGHLRFGAEDIGQAFNRQIAAIEEFGGNPLADVDQAGAAGGKVVGAEKMESAAGKHEEAAGMLMQAAKMLMGVFGGDQTPPKIGTGGPGRTNARTGASIDPSRAPIATY